MAFKLVVANGGETLLPKVVAGVTFKDGTEVVDVTTHRAAVTQNPP